MRQLGPSARRRPHRTVTTDSRHADPVADKLLNRDFSALAPNTKWVTDITGVWTSEALLDRHPAVGLLYHSDRGSQYTSGAYQARLSQRGVLVSMSGKGGGS